MRVYESDKIRNVAILGHAGSGKSNLIEAIHYTAGLANRISKPTDPIKLTTTLGLFAVEYNNYKYNQYIRDNHKLIKKSDTERRMINEWHDLCL